MEEPKTSFCSDSWPVLIRKSKIFVSINLEERDCAPFVKVFYSETQIQMLIMVTTSVIMSGAGCISKCCPDMKFFDFNLTKDVSLSLYDIYSLSASDF